MRNFFITLFLGMTVSFYFYPVGLTILPGGLNTKMVLAVVGLCLFGLEGIREKDLSIRKNVLFAGLLAVAFSLACYFSEVANGEVDGSYTTYFMTFLVWTFGAYAVCWFLRSYYGEVDVGLITKYLMWVAVFQCISAQLIERIPAVKTVVDSIFRQDLDLLEETGRIYGIGAYLDPAGVRFTITLILVAYMIVEKGKSHETSKGLLWDYTSFVIILVFGNMISRTTTVGGVLGLGYVALYSLLHLKQDVARSQLRSVGIVILLLAVAIPVISFFYATDAGFHESMRFGFEGFFNFVETGEWRTDSTDKLNREMWTWPQDSRTWLIGSGRFGNWAYGTDVGYCRFTLYCGILGFGLFCIYFIYHAVCFAKEFEGVEVLALMLLATTFIVWIKVATDIYQIYALFYCAHRWIASEE